MDKFNKVVEYFAEIYKSEKYKDNETNRSAWTKSTPTSRQQIVQLPGTTGHQDNTSLQNNYSKTNKIGKKHVRDKQTKAWKP